MSWIKTHRFTMAYKIFEANNHFNHFLLSDLYMPILKNQVYTAAFIALISIHLNYIATSHAQHSFYQGCDLKIRLIFVVQFMHDITQAIASKEAYNPIIVPITRGDELIKYKVVYSKTKGGFPISSFINHGTYI